jgi:hypothetical protein
MQHTVKELQVMAWECLVRKNNSCNHLHFKPPLAGLEPSNCWGDANGVCPRPQACVQGSEQQDYGIFYTQSAIFPWVRSFQYMYWLLKEKENSDPEGSHFSGHQRPEHANQKWIQVSFAWKCQKFMEIDMLQLWKTSWTESISLMWDSYSTS